jgi:hypothetical protein
MQAAKESFFMNEVLGFGKGLTGVCTKEDELRIVETRQKMLKQ